jgi:hypothetical protein
MLRSHAIFTTGFCVKRPQIGKHSTGIAEIKDLPDPGCVFDAIGLPPGTSFPLPVKRPHLRFEMPYWQVTSPMNAQLAVCYAVWGLFGMYAYVGSDININSEETPIATGIVP